MSGLREHLSVLAWVREGQGRSDTEIARTAAIPVARLCEFEQGAARPTLDELEAWLKALRLRWVDLGMLVELHKELHEETEPGALAKVVQSGEAAVRDFASGAVQMFVGSARRGMDRARRDREREEGGS